MSDERSVSCTVIALGTIHWDQFSETADARYNEDESIVYVKTEDGYYRLVTGEMCCRNGTTIDGLRLGMVGRIDYRGGAPCGFSCPTLFKAS